LEQSAKLVLMLLAHLLRSLHLLLLVPRKLPFLWRRLHCLLLHRLTAGAMPTSPYYWSYSDKTNSSITRLTQCTLWVRFVLCDFRSPISSIHA
jgi:hypothetical protein